MGEKLLVQRRASTNSDGGRVAFQSGLTATSVIEPNISTIAPSPFVKEEELKSEVEAPGRLGSTSYFKETLGVEPPRYKPVHPRIPAHLPVVRKMSLSP